MIVIFVHSVVLDDVQYLLLRVVHDLVGLDSADSFSLGHRHHRNFLCGWCFLERVASAAILIILLLLSIRAIWQHDLTMRTLQCPNLFLLLLHLLLLPSNINDIANVYCT